MTTIEYVYDRRHDEWSAMWKGNVLVSLSREKVVEHNELRYGNLESELRAFKDMFAEILLEQLEYVDNEFFEGAVLTKLFDNGMKIGEGR